MPIDSVEPTPRPFPPRREPDDAHDASYLAASARMASLRCRVSSIAFPCEVKRDHSRTEAEQFSKRMKHHGSADALRQRHGYARCTAVILITDVDVFPIGRDLKLRPLRVPHRGIRAF